MAPRQPRVPAPLVSRRQPNRNNGPQASALGATRSNPPSHSLNADTDANLTVALHTLAAVQSEALILDPVSDRRGDNSRLEALQPAFPTAVQQEKAPHCRLYLCQNSAASFESLRSHLQHIWRLLCSLRPRSSLYAGSKETPPRRVDDPGQDAAIEELAELAHSFVFKKVLKRILGKAEKVRILNERTDIPPECKPLLLCYFYVTQIAKLVDSNVALGTQKEWTALLVFITDLYHYTKEPGYTNEVKRLQSFVPPGSDSYFDIHKSIKKTIALNVAVISLVNLARSPSEVWVLERDLEVQSVGLPEHSTLQIPVKDFEPFLPPNLTKSEFYSKLLERQWKEEESDEVPVPVPRKIHSECKLAAAIFDNKVSLGGPPVIPYISCSKLHCVFCHSWLGLFNKTAKATLGFDGTYGHDSVGMASADIAGLRQACGCSGGADISSQYLDYCTVRCSSKGTLVSSTSSNPTGSVFPALTDGKKRLREKMIAQVTPHPTAPPLLPNSTPAAAAIPAGTSCPSLIQSTPQSWANLAANNSQKWGATKKTTPSTLQPPAPSTSGPVANIPPSSLGEGRGRGRGRGQGSGRGRRGRGGAMRGGVQ